MWQEVRAELHDQGLEIVTVALDTGGEEAAKPFVDAAAPDHPSLLDQAHAIDERFGVVNVPNGIWIDEAGRIVRPAEPAFPGRNPVMESFEKLDVSTLPPDVADIMREVKKIKTDPAAYKAALIDWVERGSESRFALSAEDVLARSGTRSTAAATAAAHFELGQHLHRSGDHAGAVTHWRESHRLQPDNWTYKRQAWNFEDPVRQGRTDAYDGSWIDDVRAVGAEHYYPTWVP